MRDSALQTTLAGLRTAPLVLGLIVVLGCPGEEPGTEDADGDGHAADVDCDDGDADTYPGAPETCDGADNDCDGEIDEGAVDAGTWYRDADGDGYGTEGETQTACDPPAGYAADPGDCDDAASATHPGADEVCDGADNDCDGDTDEDAVDPETWWPDADGDGHGAEEGSVEACEAPADHVAGTGDCDDADDEVHPDATEVCDGVDNDCDGTTDGADAADATPWYVDTDGDGYGDDATEVLACDQPSGTVAAGGDCDETDPAIHPGAIEICNNGIDEDCSGKADEICLDHCGTITADEVWTADFLHFVTCDVVVQGPSSPELSIEDGAIVMFDLDTALIVGEADHGTLTVAGGKAGVRFSSPESVPAPGDWQGVQIGALDNDSSLVGLDVEYGGGNGTAALWLDGSSPEIRNCTVRDSVSHGLFIGDGSRPLVTDSAFLDNDYNGVASDPGGGLEQGAKPGFTGNTLSGNGTYPISLPAGYVGELAPSSSFTGNGNDAIRVLAGTVDQDATWTVLDVPYLAGGDVQIEGVADPVLHIDDGVTVLFEAGVDLFVGIADHGELAVDGHTLGVTFGSVETTPQPGEWSGISFGGQDTGSMLSMLTVEHAGSNGVGAIQLHDASPEIVDCAVRESGAHGLYVGSGAFPLVQDSVFQDNTLDGVHVHSAGGLDRTGSPSFTGNACSGNGGAPLVVPADFAGELDGSSAFTGNGTDAIQLVADDVVLDATWRSLGVPYQALGDVYVQAIAAPTLTIADGVTLLFEADVEFHVGRTATGELIVEGAKGGVTFTSAEPKPEPGDWRGLYIGPSDSGSVLEGLTIEYAGGNWWGNLHLGASAPEIIDCTVRHSSAYGLYASSASRPLVQGSTFQDNQLDGIYIDATSGLSDSGPPSFTDNVLDGNGGYGISLPAGSVRELDGSSSYAANDDGGVRVLAGVVSTSSTWQALDGAFYVQGDIDIQGPTSPVLTLEDGSVFEFNYGATVVVGDANNGGLQAVGTAKAGITFTSAAASPSHGDWGGLELADSCLDAVVDLQYVTVRYGGGNGHGAVLFSGCDGTITDSAVEYSSSWGIYRQGASPTVANITYAGNTSGDLY